MALLRLILGDQLNLNVSSLKDIDKEHDIVLLCEVWEEATYVRHHKKKIAFLFSAMRHFAAELEKKGYQVRYTKLDDPKNAGSFTGEIERAIRDFKPSGIIVTHPGEYRVLQDMKKWHKRFGLPVQIRDDDRFLCGIDEFKGWAEDRKGLRMEFFYRYMRQKYSILMNGPDPEGGQWNYDADNRKPARNGLFMPRIKSFRHDEITKDVLKLVRDSFNGHFGDLEPFDFAVTRKQALMLLDEFIEKRLPEFGDYQDAMLTGEPVLYHAHLSFYINAGLLDPLEVVQKAEEAYHRKAAPLNAVEGFIRQIIGWREYVRGVYWLKMPDYARENHLDAKRKLPGFYWTGKTKMNCLHHCVTETKQNAYAHHIQRLMVLGNFALLAGLHPDEVNEWYLIVYADAYEWVELPNVTGMILFADGGLLGSKPYAASGAYIERMSDYCEGCAYNVRKKNGPDACPFNYLYWDFLDRNRAKLKGNQRLAMPYKTLAKMDKEKLKTIREDAREFLTSQAMNPDYEEEI
jgi:deoxyribodipyrimidine photolyase-related protein